MEWKRRAVEELADMVSGGREHNVGYFRYRSSSYITEFFRIIDTDYTHDGTTRNTWIAGVLTEILNEPHPDARTPPDTFCRLIRALMDKGDAKNEGPERTEALRLLNVTLNREGYEAFYADDGQCYLRHLGTNTIVAQNANPHRPFNRAEQQHREQLVRYLDTASEDELIEDVLLPLFRQLGFHRITAAGHKDKVLEYGKDIWMRYVLPTQHVLYFGIQAKKGKLDSAGISKHGSINIAEILNQVTMMLGHEIFDPEVSRRVLVDHAFIVAGGEITKAARNWLGGKLDQTKRSQVMFMDRDDILNLFVVTNLPLPLRATKAVSLTERTSS